MKRVACVAMAVLSFVTVEADAQNRRYFRSRAAFAELDTAALMDSSEMRPMDATQRFDSLMLQILDHLNTTYAPLAGFAPVRMRIWEGFSTQVHPVAGILVDRPEVDGLLTKLKERKETAGLDSAEIYRRINHVAQFVVGHEYAHLLQYAYLQRQFVDDINATRVIECAADIVGGALHQRYAATRFAQSVVLQGALAATRDFGWLIGSGNWLDATAHPIPQHRMECIRLGQRTSIADLRRLTTWSIDESRRITGAGSVISHDKSAVVVRDSSMRNFVRELVTLAEGGVEAMLELRGPALPQNTEDAFILRRSLPEPWRCVLRVKKVSATAECEATGVPEMDYGRMVSAAGEAVNRSGWRRDESLRLSEDNLRREEFHLGSADRPRARVEVVRIGASTADMMAQQSSAGQTQMAFSVTAWR